MKSNIIGSIVVFLMLISFARAYSQCSSASILSVGTPDATSTKVSIVIKVNYSTTDNGTAGTLNIDFGDGTTPEDVVYTFGKDYSVTHEYNLPNPSLMNGNVFTAWVKAQISPYSQGSYCVEESQTVTATIPDNSPQTFSISINPLPSYPVGGYPSTQKTIQMCYSISSNKTFDISKISFSLSRGWSKDSYYSIDVGCECSSLIGYSTGLSGCIKKKDDLFNNINLPLYEGVTLFKVWLKYNGSIVAETTPLELYLNAPGQVQCGAATKPDFQMIPSVLYMDSVNTPETSVFLGALTTTSLKCFDVAQFVITEPNNPDNSSRRFPSDNPKFYGSEPYFDDIIHAKNYDIDKEKSYIKYFYYLSSSSGITVSKEKILTIYPQTCNDNTYKVTTNEVTLKSHTGECLGIELTNPSNPLDDFSYISNIKVDKVNRSVKFSIADNYEASDRNFELRMFVKNGYDKCKTSADGVKKGYRVIKINQPTISSDQVYQNTEKIEIPSFPVPSNTDYIKLSGVNGTKYLADIKNLSPSLIDDISNGTGIITLEAKDATGNTLSTKSFSLNICNCTNGCFDARKLAERDISIINNPAPLIITGQYANKSIELFAQDKITLNDGFKVDDNSYFKADIKACTSTKSGQADTFPIGGSNEEMNKDNHKQNIVFEIYPNPNNGSFTIAASNCSETGMYSVTSLSGRLVARGSLKGNKTNVNMPYMHKGFYIVKIQSCNTVEFKKIIIK